MEQPTVLLSQQRENTYEFDVEVTGIDLVEVKSWFVIKADGFELTFPCTQDGDHFTCVVRPLPFLEKKTYTGCIRLVADDLYFEPINNIAVTITSTLHFSQNDIKNMHVGPEADGSVAASLTPATKAQVNHDARPLAREISPVVESNVDSAKSRNTAAVKQMLAEAKQLNKTPKPPAKKARFAKTEKTSFFPNLRTNDSIGADKFGELPKKKAKKIDPVLDALLNGEAVEITEKKKPRFVRK